MLWPRTTPAFLLPSRLPSLGQIQFGAAQIVFGRRSYRLLQNYQIRSLSSVQIRRVNSNAKFEFDLYTTSYQKSCIQAVIARRPFHATHTNLHGHLTAPKAGEELTVTIIDQQSQPHKFTVGPGDNLLDIAQANDLEMEGACGGSCACSTCHVVVEDTEYYDKIPEPEDDENDMLDLAFGLTETSRLGCQVKMSKDLNGLVVRLPQMTRNLQKSDFEKKEKGD